MQQDINEYAQAMFEMDNERVAEREEWEDEIREL